jgi:hypothetical protein
MNIFYRQIFIETTKAQVIGISLIISAVVTVIFFFFFSLEKYPEILSSNPINMRPISVRRIPKA